MKLLIFENVSRVYPGSPPTIALNKVSFDLDRGAFAVLMGPSGSGKTTLLNLASGLDQVSEGRIFIAGQEISKMDENELCRFRREQLGFVFQAYNLFSALSAVENVEYTNLLRGESRKQAREKAIEALTAVGLANKLESYPTNLSGGQQQRVAVARALATKAKIIFADEPTANLDSTSGRQVMEALRWLNKQFGTTILFVSHDEDDQKYANRVVHLYDGKISEGMEETNA
jgi:putative ABC transport system ATP-binding protein